MSQVEQQKAWDQALRNIRMLEALRRHAGVSTSTPSSSNAGEAGSTPSRSHITGRDPHSGNLRFDQVSTSPGMPSAPEISNDVTMRNAGHDESVLPFGDTSQEGQVPATYSSDSVPTPSPVTTVSPAAAATPSPPSEGNGAESRDASVRAGLHNQSVALNAWLSAPAPPSTPAAHNW